MFMPETEDMLPRAAPKPCSSVPTGHSEEMVKPTVPEVSLLFGQPPEQQLQQPQQQQHQQPAASAPRPPLGSFASWKKQLLPRVNFSPILATELGPSQAPAIPTGCVGPASNNNEYNYLPRTRAFETNHTPPGQAQNMAYAAPGIVHYARDTYPAEQLVASPRLATNLHTAASDVLTICASTQTDLEIVSPTRDSLASVDVSNLANKQDIRQLLNILDMMRQEQQQLRNLCESLAQQQQQQTCAKTVKEIGIQCEMSAGNNNNPTVKRITPIVHDYIVEEDELPATYEVPVKALAQFQSPRAVSPMAQSTAYRANTPKGRKSTGFMSPASNVPVLGAGLPKPCTEKSLVMNELALKYLPQRQIHELMDELRMSPTSANAAVHKADSSPAPLRQIDNFTQSPSNISNASYKYLKKYRLLPEEQMSSPQTAPKMQRIGSPAMSSPQSQQPMLDLDNIRNQPKLL